MKLRQPTDFLILESLQKYGRNVAPNIAETSGKSRKNVNNRLPVLADYSLVEKIGPAERSGLYEITDKGKCALQCREQYDSASNFSDVVQRRLESSSNGGSATIARGEEQTEQKSNSSGK